MAVIRQTSFASGELSPYLYGRTDLELFAHGARTLTNFFVNRQGNAVSRPGTIYKAAALRSHVALIPFVSNAGESFVLEFTPLVVRIYDTATFTLVDDFVTEFTAAELPELQWAQQGDLITVVHRNHAGFTLHAPVGTSADARWIFSALQFAPKVINFLNLGAPPSHGWATPQATFMGSGGTFHARPVLRSRGAGALDLFDLSGQTAKQWLYRVSTTFQHNTTGELRESLSVPITRYWRGTVPTLTALPSDNLLILSDTAPIWLEVPTTEPAEPGSGALYDWTPVSINYYRGRSRDGVGIYGFIGSTDTVADFVDKGDEPDYLNPPLQSGSPFSATSPGPAAVAYFQQRLALGGSIDRPATWWTSATDEFYNFKPPTFTRDSMPLEVTLTGRKRERIVSMLALEHLLAFTDSSVWVIGRPELALTPANLSSSTRLVDEVGSLPLQPLAVDGAALFVRAKGRGVRELRPSQGGFDGSDASWHAEHLFRGLDARIVSWCYQRDPWGVIWAVRDDGVLLSCTRTGNGWAWATHETGDGAEVKSVCCVPEADGDVVYLAVYRQRQTFIERMVGPAEINASRNFSLDSQVVQSTVSNVVDSSLSGFAHLEGETVWAVADGYAPQGPLVVTGGAVVLQPWTVSGWPGTAPVDPQPPALAIDVAVGLPYTCDLELLDAKPGSPNQKAVVKVGFEVDNASGLQAGEDFDHLVDWQQRTVADSYEYPSAASALVVVTVKGSWRRTGRAVLRQAKPLPVIVLGITRELSEGG